jgi:hypothetical protein
LDFARFYATKLQFATHRQIDGVTVDLTCLRLAGRPYYNPFRRSLPYPLAGEIVEKQVRPPVPEIGGSVAYVLLG